MFTPRSYCPKHFFYLPTFLHALTCMCFTCRLVHHLLWKLTKQEFRTDTGLARHSRVEAALAYEQLAYQLLNAVGGLVPRTGLDVVTWCFSTLFLMANFVVGGEATNLPSHRRQIRRMVQFVYRYMQAQYA